MDFNFPFTFVGFMLCLAYTVFVLCAPTLLVDMAFVSSLEPQNARSQPFTTRVSLSLQTMCVECWSRIVVHINTSIYKIWCPLAMCCSSELNGSKIGAWGFRPIYIQFACILVTLNLLHVVTHLCLIFVVLYTHNRNGTTERSWRIVYEYDCSNTRYSRLDS